MLLTNMIIHHLITSLKTRSENCQKRRDNNNNIKFYAKSSTYQSATLFRSAATKPTMLKLNSVQLVRAKPPTTGIKDRLINIPVRFLSTTQLIMTVKNGAADFIVSVNDTATYARLSRDNTTLRNL